MKNKTRKIIGVACAILLIVLVQAIGITYAKYFTEESGSGKAEVAKWAFEIVKDGEESKTIDLANTVTKDSLVDGKIAPGTYGYINLSLDATGSEVNMEYKIEFANEKNKPNNIFFTYEGVDYKSLSEIDNITGLINHDDESKVKDIQIRWMWTFETGTTDDEKITNNEIDTQNANTITEYTFDVIATGTQCSK